VTIAYNKYKNTHSISADDNATSITHVIKQTLKYVLHCKSIKLQQRENSPNFTKITALNP